MDSLNYTYYANTNQLSQVRDKVSATKYTTDIDNQNANNYTYDATGNMVSAASDSISNITWNVYGKIATITKNAKQIKYTYDASGNRIMKQTPTDTTVYVRDATGNVMSVYYKPANDTLVQSEMHLYGSSRLGMATQHLAPDTSVVLTGGFSNGIKSIFTRGEKLFELSNHLGNVLATISDRRLQTDTNSDGTVESYKADIISANDYYPFGMLMPKEIPDSTLISSGFDAGLDGWAVYNAGTLSNDNGRLKFSGSQVWSSLKKDLQLKTGKQYRVRFTIDMGNCTELHLPICKADISSYETLSGVGLSITASGTYEGTFTATSNSMIMIFEMIPGVNPPPDSTGYYWIDDVTVEEIKPADTSHAGKGGYRYAFNGQEKSTEINSSGNLYTAEFWEYDSRIGRRWNIDPRPNISISPYNCFAGNPILYPDNNGDSIPTKFYGTNGEPTDVIPDKVQKMFNSEYGIKVGFNSKTSMLYYDGEVETDNKVSPTAKSKLTSILSSTYSRKKSLRKYGDIVIGHNGLTTPSGTSVDESDGMAGELPIRILGLGSRHTLYWNIDAFTDDDLTLKSLDFSGLTSKGYSSRTFNMARAFEHEFFGHGIQRRRDPSNGEFTAGKVEFLPNLFRTEIGLPLRANYGIGTGKGTVILFGINASNVRKIVYNYNLVPTAPFVLRPILKK
jgi:YD repeat-containing protein